MAKPINLLSADYQKKLYIVFFIGNIIIIIFGVVIILITARVERLDTEVIKFMQTNTDYNDDHEYLLYASSSILVFTGLCGIFCTFYECRIIFKSYDGLLHIAFAMTAIAAITPGLVTARPDQVELESILRAEIYHHTQEIHFRKIWGENGHNWHHLQAELECCGVNDFRDWLFSSLESIPVSCCLKVYREECKSNLLEGSNLIMKKLNISDPNFAHIYTLITKTGCLAGLQNTISDLKGLWIKYPMIFILCFSIIMPWTSYFAHMVRLIEDSIDDIVALHHLHHQMKLLVQDSDTQISPQSGLGIPPLFIPTGERLEDDELSHLDVIFSDTTAKIPQRNKRGDKLEIWDDESK